ncbi:sugar ABC transporter substrate-binding protein [Solihabitans fulvus]|uniref:Sugar ABC transporter substrate-binding protein n=1 Tax=Solihabitans fulvus TaxID=1892852 RepID=A0A5B2XJ12_9PSEU|nr:sugar ABC transporter substrate-binding protein [Solihabitans fulvus]KAA2263214.1 sugar ABC transporter substrate-binding protein [Solihabitans fulvus]
MPNLAREPTFLPLTVTAANTAVDREAPARSGARVVLRRAETANRAAADCWTALLAGCNSNGRRVLSSRLRELSEATSVYAGTQWWLSDGAVHRHRVAEAEGRIDEAVREGDGAEFAEAFVGYDQAVATVVVLAQNKVTQSRMGSPTT